MESARERRCEYASGISNAMATAATGAATARNPAGDIENPVGAPRFGGRPGRGPRQQTCVRQLRQRGVGALRPVFREWERQARLS